MYKLLIVLVCSIAWSCAEQETSQEEKFSALVGEWQLVEAKIGIGPPGTWEPVEDGNIYKLNPDSTFSISTNPNCTSGSFSIDGNTLNLSFNCPDYNAKWSFQYNQDGSHLFLSNLMCIEGCEYKYKRL